MKYYYREKPRKRLAAIGMGASICACPTSIAQPGTAQVTGVPWDEAASHLIRDRDEAFGSAYTQRIREMGILPAQNLLRDATPSLSIFQNCNPEERLQ